MCVVAHLSERKRQDHLTPLSKLFSLCSRCLLLHICLRERDRITSLLSRSSSVSAAGVCCCTSERKRQDHPTPLSKLFSLCSRCVLLHICLGERDRITSLLSKLLTMALTEVVKYTAGEHHRLDPFQVAFIAFQQTSPPSFLSAKCIFNHNSCFACSVVKYLLLLCQDTIVRKRLHEPACQ